MLVSFPAEIVAKSLSQCAGRSRAGHHDVMFEAAGTNVAEQPLQLRHMGDGCPIWGKLGFVTSGPAGTVLPRWNTRAALLDRAPSGGSSPHSASMSCSELTDRPCDNASAATIARWRRLVTGRSRPSRTTRTPARRCTEMSISDECRHRAGPARPYGAGQTQVTRKLRRAR